MNRVLITLLAVSLFLVGAPAAQAQVVTTIVDDPFDDGDILLNGNGTGNGFLPSNISGKTWGELVGGPAFWDTDGEDWASQQLHSLDEYDFLTAGGITTLACSSSWRRRSRCRRCPVSAARADRSGPSIRRTRAG